MGKSGESEREKEEASTGRAAVIIPISQTASQLQSTAAPLRIWPQLRTLIELSCVLYGTRNLGIFSSRHRCRHSAFEYPSGPCYSCFSGEKGTGSCAILHCAISTTSLLRREKRVLKASLAICRGRTGRHSLMHLPALYSLPFWQWHDSKL